jgi:hypothetical protein
MSEINKLRQQVRNNSVKLAGMEAKLKARYQALKAHKDQVTQGLNSVRSGKDLAYNLHKSLPAHLTPGNVGNYYRVIWPFFFTTSKVRVEPNTSKTSIFTTTLEAGFVCTGITKSVFEHTEDKDFIPKFIDDSDTTDAGDTDSLSCTIRDSQSSRNFMGPETLDVNSIPSSYLPTPLEVPVYFLPKASVEVTWFNENPNLTYIPYLTFHGYRIRIENDRDILSTVFG